MSPTPSFKMFISAAVLFWFFFVILKLIGFAPLIPWEVLILPPAAPICTVLFYMLMVTLKVMYEDYIDKNNKG